MPCLIQLKTLWLHFTCVYRIFKLLWVKSMEWGEPWKGVHLLLSVSVDTTTKSQQRQFLILNLRALILQNICFLELCFNPITFFLLSTN